MEQLNPITPGQAAKSRGLKAITAQQILMKYLNFYLEKRFKKGKFSIYESWFKETPGLGFAQYQRCVPNKDIRNSVRDAFIEAGWQVTWYEHHGGRHSWEFIPPMNLEYPELV